MSAKTGEVFLTRDGADGFLNSSIDDLNICVTDTSQKIHIGVDLDKEANIIISSTGTVFNSNVYCSNLNVSGSLTHQNKEIVPSQWYNSSNNSIYLLNSNVGIGTSSPTEKLHIAGNLKVDNTIVASNVNFIGQLQFNGQKFEPNSQWSTCNTSIYYLSNVGIKTNQPREALEVNGNIISTGTITTSNINFYGNLLKNGAPYVSSAWSNQDSNVMWASNINVGIGTSTPQYRLDVKGDAQISSNVYLNGNIIRNGIPITWNQWKNNSASNLVYIESNIAIGKSNFNSNAMLDIAGNVSLDGTLNASNINFSGSLLQNGAPYVSSAWSNQDSNIMWASNINVGIGTSNPQYRLDVKGDAQISSHIYANSNIYLNGDIIKNGVKIKSSQWTDINGNDGVFLPSGKIGVGISNPDANLDVSGSIKANVFTSCQANIDEFYNNTSTINTLNASNASTLNMYSSNLSSSNAILKYVSASNILSSNIVTNYAYNSTLDVANTLTAKQANLSNLTLVGSLTPLNISTTTNIINAPNISISNGSIIKFNTVIPTFSTYRQENSMIVKYIASQNTNVSITNDDFNWGYIVNTYDIDDIKMNSYSSSNISFILLQDEGFEICVSDNTIQSENTIMGQGFFVTTSKCIELVSQIMTSCNVHANKINSSVITASNIYVTGAMVVQGTVTSIDTETVQLSNNMIVINKGQTGNPLSSNMISGIQVQRSNPNSNFYFVYSESNQNFRVGLSNKLQTVATRLDNIQQGSIAWWDDIDHIYKFSSNLIISSNNYLGIGTNTPTEMIHVQSNIKADGSIYSLSNLTSNIVTKYATISNTLNVFGATTISNTLIVASNVTASCNLTVGGVLTTSNSLLSNTNLYGTTNAYNGLNVLGQAVFSNNVNASNLTVNGTLTVLSNIVASNITVCNITYIDSTVYNINQSGTLTISSDTGSLMALGPATFCNNANLFGSNSLCNAIISGYLSNIGDTRLNGIVNIFGPSTISNTLSVASNVTASCNMFVGGTFITNGATTHCNSLYVTGVTGLSNTLAVASNITASCNLSVGGVLNAGTAVLSNVTLYNTTTACNVLNVFGLTTISNRLFVNSNTTFSNGSVSIAGTGTSSGISLSVRSSGTDGGFSPIAQFFNSNGAPNILIGSYSTCNVYISYNSNDNTGRIGIFGGATNFYITPTTTGTTGNLIATGKGTFCNEVLVISNSTFCNALNVFGATSVSNNLNVASNIFAIGTLVTNGATTHCNSLHVTGVTGLSNALNVASNVTASCNLTVGGVLTSSNAVLSNTVLYGTTTTYNSLNVSGSINVSSNAVFSNNLIVIGAASFSNNINTLGITLNRQNYPINMTTGGNQLLSVSTPTQTVPQGSNLTFSSVSGNITNFAYTSSLSNFVYTGLPAVLSVCVLNFWTSVSNGNAGNISVVIKRSGISNAMTPFALTSGMGSTFAMNSNDTISFVNNTGSTIQYLPDTKIIFTLLATQTSSF